MGAIVSIPASSETSNGPSCARSSHGSKWHFVGAKNWGTRDLPERYGKWTTVYSRFQRWRKAGMWDRILKDVQALVDQDGNVDWEIHFVYSTIVRAHQHAAGAKRGIQKQRR